MSTNPPVIWLASYPKSGNTWIRFMIYAALHGPPERSTDVPSKIQDLHRTMPTDLNPQDKHYIKTHYELNDQHPKLNDTIKAIHIIRNPKDVLISTLNYHRLNGVPAAQLPAKLYAKQFIAQAGDPHFHNSGFGTWASNARSWRSNTSFPVLPLRYEDLKANPESELLKALDFLDIQRTPGEIEASVAASSFDAMRALEIREKHALTSNDLSKRLFVGSTDSTRKGIYFMNTGKSGQSLDSIAPGLDAQFNSVFKDQLDEFGY